MSTTHSFTVASYSLKLTSRMDWRYSGLDSRLSHSFSTKLKTETRATSKLNWNDTKIRQRQM